MAPRRGKAYWVTVGFIVLNAVVFLAVATLLGAPAIVLATIVATLCGGLIALVASGGKPGWILLAVSAAIAVLVFVTASLNTAPSPWTQSKEHPSWVATTATLTPRTAADLPADGYSATVSVLELNLKNLTVEEDTTIPITGAASVVTVTPPKDVNLVVKCQRLCTEALDGDYTVDSSAPTVTVEATNPSTFITVDK